MPYYYRTKTTHDTIVIANVCDNPNFPETDFIMSCSVREDHIEEDIRKHLDIQGELVNCDG